MNQDTPPSSDKDNVLVEVHQIREELEKLNQHYFVQANSSMKRMMLFFLLRGMLLGFGTVIGATVVVSVFVFLLSQIEFIPIVGDWVSQVIEQIQQRTP